MARAADLRGDEAALKALAEHGGAAFYVIGGDLILLKTRGEELDPLFAASETRELGATGETVFLGILADGAPRFAVSLDAAAIEPVKVSGRFAAIDLRSLALQGVLAVEHLPPLAEAKAVLSWHVRHRFCPNCAAPTRSVQGGWRRDCPSCKCEHFPRTDPVVIMLAIGAAGGERCVLGRSPRFPKTMWSCLAGFVEPGESIEEAVRREVQEEVGIVCSRVRYFASQPWPFPSSLMIGCYAKALSEEIAIEESEIEEARWFEREELKLMLACRHPHGLTAPPPIAIAHHIIRAFADGGRDVLA